MKQLANSPSHPSTNLTADSSTDASTDPIVSQLKRISGQVDGIINMYQNERVCVDITRQVLAVRNSLGRVARDLLTSEASRCSHEKRTQDLDIILKELFKYE